MDRKYLLYKYIAGSTLYNCNEKDSDIDTKGIYMASLDDLYGLGVDDALRKKIGKTVDLYKPQISDSRNDNILYELGKFMAMMLTSNPSAIEGLFIPKDKVIVEADKCLEPLFANKDAFVTKECFNAFTRYSIEQIRKARGLNKKIVNPMTERLGVLDFIYTTYKQGSTKITNWLEYRGMKQRYCGLVNIPNMRDLYGVYYDWGAHFSDEGITEQVFDGMFTDFYSNPDKKGELASLVDRLKGCRTEEERVGLQDGMIKATRYNMMDFICRKYQLLDDDTATMSILVEKWYKKQKPIGYKGIVGPDSDEVRLSSVSKGETTVCYVSYNKDGYSSHCADYKDYRLWVKNRNEKRYESNLDKTYDSKNMFHCMRLIHMGIEIARGEGVILDRVVAGDRDLLMDIRHHKYEYEELMKMVREDEKRLKEAIETSTIPEKVDISMINDLLIEMRRNFYKDLGF